jgi:exopolyphosphatase / guanosine-5'-triphosphate,3'-diphosphate pyrophosphatase
MIISSIDIGTNTVLLLLAKADTKNNKIIPLLNEYRIPRIGKNLGNTGIISAESIDKLIQILLEYKKISSDYNSQIIIASATAAFRNASNSSEILNEVLQTTGININIISGEQEAKFAYLGVSDGIYDNKEKVIIDIGGGSTEIIAGMNEKLLFSKSFNTGVVSSGEKFKESDNFINALQDFYGIIFKEIRDLNISPGKAFAIAGTPTTISAIKLNLTQFDAAIVEGSILSRSDIMNFIESYSENPGDYLNKFSNILSGREDLIIPGSLILLEILNNLSLNEITVSTKGIRHGAVINYLNDHGWVF